MRLQLQVIQLDARRPAEQAHRDANLPLVRHNLFHRTAEIRERPLGNLHHLADQEWDLLLRLFLLRHLLDAEETVHLLLAERLRSPSLPYELDDALDAVDDVRGLLVHDHFHQHVTGEALSLDRHLLAVLDLHGLLDRNQRLADEPLIPGLRVGLDLPIHQRTNLVLMTRGGLDGVPAMLHDYADHPNARPSTSIRSLENTKSIRPITSPMARTNAMITNVDFRRSSSGGHDTLRNSARTSR